MSLASLTIDGAAQTLDSHVGALRELADRVEVAAATIADQTAVDLELDALRASCELDAARARADGFTAQQEVAAQLAAAQQQAQAGDAQLHAVRQELELLGGESAEQADQIAELQAQLSSERSHSAERLADERPRTLFKSVAVFDVSQTEPLPGHEPVALGPDREPITGDSHVHLLAPLTALAAQLGFRVEHRVLDGGADGWCDSKHKLIVVNQRLPANARVRVLVHEIAHALGISYADRGRARVEVMVDCVIFWRGRRICADGCWP